MKQRVLFLCTGNSCRSQLAEALVNARLGERWDAFSAGVRPTGFVHPLALQVLDEVGIRHEGRSKSVEEFHGQAFNLVMTVCDSAAEECPLWLGQGRRVHLDFPDPARASGSPEQVLQAFRNVRDGMIEKILRPLEQWPEVEFIQGGKP
jgi:arsenate reductase (thioredoxin)